MKNIPLFKTTILSSCIFLFIIISFVIIDEQFGMHFNEYPQFSEEAVVEINNIKMISSDGSSKNINLPQKIDDAEKTYYFKFIPRNFSDSGDLLYIEIYSRYVSYNLKYNDFEIFSLSSSDNEFPKSGGHYLKYIKIPRKYLNKPITLEFKQNIHSFRNASIPSVRIGTKSALIRQHHKEDFYSVIFSTLFFISFIELLVVAIVLWKNKIESRQVLTIALMCILIATLSAIRKPSVYLLFRMNIYIYSAMFIALLLIPISLLLILKNEFIRRNIYGFRVKILDSLITLAIINTIMQLTLFLIRKKEFVELQFFTELILTMSVLAVFIIPLTLNSKICKDKKYIILNNIPIPLVYFTMGILFEIKPKINYWIYISFFTVLFFVLQSAIVFKDYIKKYNALYTTELYKKMAFIDKLTNLANRNSFENDIKELLEGRKFYKNIFLMVLDINNLKKTNDTKGHHTGDRLIRGLANILKSVEVFNIETKAYRTGGDEFILLSKDISQDDIKKIIDKIDIETKKFTEKNQDLDFSFAYAYDTEIFTFNFDIKSFIANVDAKMYEHKINSKNK